MRIVYRQLQEIPFEKWMQEIELERHTDENEEHSQIRVHIRAYDNFEHYGELFEAFMEDETGQKDEVVRHNFYNWEREELYFIDDPIDVEPLKAELAEIERRKKG